MVFTTVKRVTVSLPDELAQALKREARRQHASVSAVTRAALVQHLGPVQIEPRELAFADLGHSGHHTTARDMEQFEDYLLSKASSFAEDMAAADHVHAAGQTRPAADVFAELDTQDAGR
jgi:plasmid stability protein